MNGQTLLNSPLKVFAASVLMWLPSTTIALTVVVRAGVARWLNIIFGMIFTGIMLLITITSIPVTAKVAAYVFYAIIESALNTFIVPLAWHWPKS